MGTSDCIDHIHYDTLDNRKRNLQKPNRKGNCRKRKGANKNNSSGYRNVSFDSKGRPIVQLQDENGKNKVWRNFKDVHEAGAFAKEMRDKMYGEFSGR